jgi:predicted dehydrogenase
MGRAWARALLDCDQTDLAGWCDIREGAVEEAIALMRKDEPSLELLGVVAGDDEAKMLDDLKPDMIVDATPPQAHCEVELMALERGIPVLGEKPMADSMEAARKLVAAAKRAGALYMVSQSRRYNPMMAAFRELIASLGQVGMLNADFDLGPHFGGFRDKMPSPLLLDMAIHTFDQARYLTGADALTVYCEEFNPPWSWYEGAASANALFTMTGDLHFAYRGSWCAEGLPTSWDGQWRAIGARGSAVWDGEKPPVAEIVASREGGAAQVQRVEAAVSDDAPSGIAGALLDFVRALTEGTTPQGECTDNIKSLAMVFGAIESAQTGQRVDVTKLLA